MFEDYEEELMELDGLLEDGEFSGAYESSWEDLEEETGLYEDGEGLFEEEIGLFEDGEMGLFEDGEFGTFEDLEADPFVGNLVRKAGRAIKRAARSPIGGALKGLAKQAAQVAGGAIAGPTGAKLAGMLANQVIRESDQEGLYEGLYESDGESDPETDLEAMGGDPEIYEEMEYLASLAAESDNEEEADQFIGAIASLAGPLISSLVGGDAELLEDMEDGEIYEDEADPFLPALIPLAASILPKAIPLVSKGIRAVGKALSGSKRSRKAIRTLPRVAAKTATSLARQAKAGRPISRKRVAATMARQTAKNLVKPARLAKAMRRNKAVARRRVFRKGPVVRPVRRVVAGRPVRTPAVRPSPTLVRRAVGPVAPGAVGGGVGGAVPGYGGIIPSDAGPGRAYGRRRRIIRPRYCVY
jgi:hypothetical protein